MSSLSNSVSRRSPLLEFLIRTGPGGLVAWTIVVSAIVRLAFAAAIGYGTGEGYYVASARHLALSYFDQPPLSLWLTWGAIKLAGAASAVAIRAPFVAMFAVTTWLMYRLGARLFGEWAGAWAAVLLNLSIVFAVSIGSWVQPDGPLFLFLLAAALAIVELCFGKPSRPVLLWAAAGALFGLALLSKYHAALTLAGLVLFVATTPGYRAWFFRPALLLAALIAAVFVLPVVIWNWQNGWVSFVFQATRAEWTGLHFDWLAGSILGQAAIVGPLIWPAMIVALVAGLRSGPRDAKVWFLCCLAIIPIVLFTAIALWAPVGTHFHWQAPGYVFLFPLLGRAVAERIERGDRLVRPWLVISAVIVLAAPLLLGTQARFGWFHSILPANYRALPYDTTNPTREIMPWSGLRAALVKEGVIPGDRAFAVVTTWLEVGKVDTELGDDMPVVCLCADPRNIAFGWDDARFAGWDAVIVTPTTRQEDTAAEYAPYFRAIGAPAFVDVLQGGEVALTLRIDHARDYYRRYPVPLPLPRVGSGG